MKPRTHKRKLRRGGGYGFGGSILGDQGGANAGNTLWAPDTSKDCYTGSDRGGNGRFAGGKRTKKNRKRRGGAISNASLNDRGGNHTMGGRRRRRNRRGGNLQAYQTNPAMIQQAPRTGYTFDGSGVAGTANTVMY